MSADLAPMHVTAVVVTYNRPDLLRESLDALADQTRPADRVIIIDNASTDESGRVADEHHIGADVLHLNRNVGGAGGFTAGMAHALRSGEHTDFLWIMDDDTVPLPDALAELLAADHRLQQRGISAAVLSSRAVWTDGRDHPMNSSRTRLGVPQSEVERFAEIGVRPIRTASFVSALIRAGEVRTHGLPKADYFIWSDDFEFTGRLLRSGQGFAVPGSVVEHRTVAFSNAAANPGSRMRYDVRNRLWTLLRTDSFTRKEQVLYGGKSALGWGRTLLRTRGDLLPIAWRGLREGLREMPRMNAVVLGADPERAEEIRAVEKAARR